MIQDKLEIGNKFKILDKEVEVVSVEWVQNFPSLILIYTLAYINNAGEICLIKIRR